MLFRSIDDEGQLVGIVTPTGLVRTSLYRPNVDASGRLRVAAAVGVNGDVAGRTAELVDLGVGVIVVDTAPNGHTVEMLQLPKTTVVRKLRDLQELNVVYRGKAPNGKAVGRDTNVWFLSSGFSRLWRDAGLSKMKKKAEVQNA